MKTISKLIARLYIAAITFILVIGTVQAQYMADRIIIRGTSFDLLQDAQDGDTMSIEFHDGKLFSKATSVTLSMFFDSDITKGFYIVGLKDKAVLNINIQGNDIRGNIQIDGCEYVYILDSWNGRYIFIKKEKGYLIAE